MILESLRLKWISDEIGYGLFAAETIKKGTITYVQDGMDIVIKPQEQFRYPENVQPIIEKYSFENHLGDLIICWDLGKYMNHSCSPNSLTTGYGFDIALEDIQAGQEVTDDYRIFCKKLNFIPSCQHPDCIEHRISSELIHYWDDKLRSAMSEIQNVEQPLLNFVDSETLTLLESFKQDSENYVSVATQLPVKNQRML